MPAEQFRRYHALDALRAAMMLLGLVIHAAASYTATPLGTPWPYSDPARAAMFDLVVFFIHLFRMPVFFVVAGFFAALLHARDGIPGFAWNRGRRVVLPLALFWLPLFPLVFAGFDVAISRTAGAPEGAPNLWEPYLRQSPLMHLWFLWYLAIFYAVALVIVPTVRRAPASWHLAADAWFGRIATSVAGILLLASVSTATLLPMETPGLDTSMSLLPPVRVLVAYGVFFTFGWLLFRRRDLIERIGERWKPSMAAGVLTGVAYLLVVVARPIADARMLHVVAAALASLSIWLLIVGIIGSFVAVLERPRPVVRYLSDAAYWIYLVHLPLTIWTVALLGPTGLPAILKFALVLLTTLVVTIATYHWLVRATAAGILLNGRRYARSLPSVATAADQVAV